MDIIFSMQRPTYTPTARDARFRSERLDCDTLLIAGFSSDEVIAVAAYRLERKHTIGDILAHMITSFLSMITKRHSQMHGVSKSQTMLSTAFDLFIKGSFRVPSLRDAEDRDTRLEFEMLRVLFRVLCADKISDTVAEKFASSYDIAHLSQEDRVLITDSASNCRPFITGSSYFGLASRAVAVGDIVALFPTGTYPFLLREFGTRQVNGTGHAAYILLGACYVEGRSLLELRWGSALTGTGIMHVEPVDKEASRVYKEIHDHDWDSSEKTDANLAFRNDICLV